MSKNLILDRFAEPVTALADTPALAAAELKRRFQAPAEELRQVHNALAEQHAALEDKVEGIVTETYGGTIHESMLDTPLAAKINAKAEQSDMVAVQTALAGKCGVAIGTYDGDGAESQFINLGFTPAAVLVVSPMGRMYSVSSIGGAYYDGGLALPGHPVSVTDYNSNTYMIFEVTEGGFTVYSTTYKVGNNNYYVYANQGTHYYIAFR